MRATLLESGAVSSGALDAPTEYHLADDPYPDVLGVRGNPAAMLTPAQVAVATADAAPYAVPFTISR